MSSDIDPVKLVVLPFLQHWDSTSEKLSLRILLVPRDSFIVPYVPDDLASPKFFPNAELKFEIHILSGVQGSRPTLQSGIVVQNISLIPDASYARVFKDLVETFGESITSINPKRARDADNEPRFVRKHLPLSYRKATGYTPDGGAMFTTDSTYSCAMKQVRDKPYRKVMVPEFQPSWGELIASILRIPDFAVAAGFIRMCDISIPAQALKDGAYVWCELDRQIASNIGVIDAAAMKTFAARILPVYGSSDLFTPLLFPVIESANSSVIPGETYDQTFREFEDYADGWAKAVHCAQSQTMAIVGEYHSNARPPKDLGIRLGWDDEQVTIWADRQIDPSKAAFDNFPVGIHGYRVDVLDSHTSQWFSLSHAKGDFGIGDMQAIGQITSELGVELHPTTSMDVVEDRSYWMPMYFTNWTQNALVGMDEKRMKLLGRYNAPPPVSAPNTKFPHFGVVDSALQLRYGRKYQFRVRLMDHTGGGPTLESASGTFGPSPTASITFLRWIKPLAPQLVRDIPKFDNRLGAETALDFIELERPLMFYPAVMFAGYEYNGRDAEAELLSIADDIYANPPAPGSPPATEPGLPDPDVDRVEITVLVQIPAQDPLATDGPFMELYTTTWDFPPDLKARASIPLTWTDCKDIWDPANDWASSTTALLLPRARTVRLRIKALCREQPENPYFGAKDVRYGHPQLVYTLRKNAVTEPEELFAPATPSQTINGFFLQPGLDLTAQLAAALGLRSKDTTLRAAPGKRVVFACCSSIMHVMGPDQASLTFASQASLALHWIIVIRLFIKRDWSWDGFPLDGIKVTRDNSHDVVTFAPRREVNEDAISAPTPERSSTEVIIIDILDPKPPPGEFPNVKHVEYKVETNFVAGIGTTSLGQRKDLSLDLPVVTPPTQVPQLASAGIAMSPYIHDDAYTTTLPRTKMLWLEFTLPPQDPDDRYFCRILKYAPDPLLLPTLDFSTSDAPEPPIPLDPERIRRIVPLQSIDVAGLDAMQPLIPTSSPYHWGLPLPPGLTEDSLELLGFWTYEFRVGHWNDQETHTRWSTAQARFGPVLRVAGVQHPAPQLRCSLNHDEIHIRVSARFAQPVLDGKPLWLGQPRTQMWFLLYAQAAIIDGSGEKKNILVARTNGTSGEGNRLESTATFALEDVVRIMEMYGLQSGTPLSVLAVEMLGQRDRVRDPLGGDLGRQRILRSSCLVAVPHLC